jgi:hypothetical protein
MFKFFKINIENLKKWIDEIKTTQKKSNCDSDCGCHKSQRDESLKLSIIGELKHRIPCNQKQIIYMYLCKVCNKIYIGQSGDSMLIRHGRRKNTNIQNSYDGMHDHIAICSKKKYSYNPILDVSCLNTEDREILENLLIFHVHNTLRVKLINKICESKIIYFQLQRFKKK